MLDIILVAVLAQLGGFFLNLLQMDIKWKGKTIIRPCFNYIKIPSIVGMILMGVLARNISQWTLDTFNDELATYIRSFSLMIILVRGSLELKFKGRVIAVFILTFVPFTMETIFDFILIRFGLKFPVAISFSFGLCLSAVAPAVVVPLMLHLI